MEKYLPLNSIIIPLYLTNNDSIMMASLVFDCLLIQKKSTPLELIVVDDNSLNQKGLKILEKKYKHSIYFLKMKNRLGLVKALNAGIALAKGELVTYCHSDCLAQKASLANIAKIFFDPKVGMVISNLFYPNNTLQQSGGWIDSNFNLSWSKTKFYVPTDIHWGDFWTIRLPLVKSIGFLDEQYAIGYWEGVDISTATRMLGLRVVTCPESKIIHFHGATFKHLYSQHERQIFYEHGRKVFKKKWGDRIATISSGVLDEAKNLNWK